MVVTAIILGKEASANALRGGVVERIGKVLGGTPIVRHFCPFGKLSHQAESPFGFELWRVVAKLGVLATEVVRLSRPQGRNHVET